MSVELALARFAPDEMKRDDAVMIPMLANLARAVFKELGRDEGDVFVPSGGEVIQIDLPGGTAEVHSEYALFPIQTLDLLTLRLVFEIAKAGDMVIITEGGKYSGILTNVAQRSRLPVDWHRPEVTLLCQSTEHLELLLQGWHAVHKKYAGRAFRKPRDGKRTGETPSGVATNEVSTSQLVYLHHFDRSAHPKGRHPNVLRDLLQTTNAILEAEQPRKGSVAIGRFNDEFKIKLPTGSAYVFSNHAVFDVAEVDVLMARMMFEVARAGDMAIIVWKPNGCHTFLTDRDQMSRVPDGWTEHENSVTFCRSPKELMPLLRSKLELDIPANQRRKFLPQDPWAPGTRPDPLAEFIYIEAKPKETASKHVNKLFKFHRERARSIPDPPSGPGSRGGILKPEFWELENPDGTSFYAYSCSGEKEWWLSMINDFASAEGRAVGRIANFDIFVQNNDHIFPVKACRCARVWK